MRERINRLAKGIIDTEKPDLILKPESFEEGVLAGEMIKRELLVISDNGLSCKGLVYSSNPRVKASVASFGGLRSHIYIEVNTRHLNQGDVIEGELSLVTNGGERRVPYRFTAEKSGSGQILESLKTPGDLAELYKKDPAMAVRIFEYRDFTELPFMQDISTRTMYDGLKGHGSSFGQLEQFLIGLGAKQPAVLSVAETEKDHGVVTELLTDCILLRKEGWGYLPVEVETEGAFIRTMKKTVTEDDFIDGQCAFSYQISPDELHMGRNFGRIRFVTVKQETVVELYAAAEAEAEEPWSGESRYARYFRLRLEYEGTQGEKEELQSQMLDELEQLMMVYGSSRELSLMSAELFLLLGKREPAKELLESCEEWVLQERAADPARYCLYQYLRLLLNPDEKKEASLVRLLQKYLDEGSGDYLILWIYRRLREQECFENPSDYLSRMMVLYSKGCHSPFLYQEALCLYNEGPQILCGVGRFEIQVLYFGARRGQVAEELAVKAAKLILINRSSHPLELRTLKLLYEAYDRDEILEAVCGLMIRGDMRRPADFVWYERALKRRLSLTRLYEYFLYSLPENYGRLLPKEVLLYFSYDHELDWRSRSVLYSNIISYMKPEDRLYREYQKAIGTFAVEQILAGRIDEELAVIYEAAVFEDMIDLPIAKELPALLRTCRIMTRDRAMKYVVVRYQELKEEGIYPLRNGVAYAPVFSKSCIFLFQDAYGNRYTDVRHVRRAALSMPALEQRCFDIYPEHPMLLLGAVEEAAEKEIPEETDLLVIERALEGLGLHPLFRRKLAGKLAAYCETQSREGAAGLFCPEVDETLLTNEQRGRFCQALIRQGEMDRAYELLKEYFCPVHGELLGTLCSRMILNCMFDEDDRLLLLAFQAFEEGNADHVILDYLCEHFNGLTEPMFRLLKKSVAERTETYDLEERLLAQMMFADVTDHMDWVFSLYVERKKSSDLVVKAYFTMKCSEYFFKDIPAGDQVFQYLESLLSGTAEKDRISLVYLLALTKYYAGLPRLKKEQAELCQELVDILLGEGVTAAHLKELSGKVLIPGEIMDKALIQYIGRKDSRVELETRILPQQEQFQSDDIKRVYQGIFIKQKVLFEGETLEYRIFEQKGGQRLLMKQGQVTAGSDGMDWGDRRFRLLNQMSVCVSLEDEEGLREAIQEYMRKTAAVEEMFFIR